ncbi:MAG: hypothetical protein KAI72_03350 [Candidatus Pacebacteria bacterium]|nr:hypothetical protein [Candidatus Paceibacterota bacterium]
MFHKKVSKFNILVLLLLSPLISFAQGSVPNPLGPTGPNDIPTFLNSLFADIVKIGAVVLAFYIVYSGYLFVSAQGNEQALQKAKDSFKWVLIGGAILLGAQVLSSAILKTINTIGP